MTVIQNFENKESRTLSIQIRWRILVILWVDRVLESRKENSGHGYSALDL